MEPPVGPVGLLHANALHAATRITRRAISSHATLTQSCAETGNLHGDACGKVE
jgi:hypothetical protein